MIASPWLIVTDELKPLLAKIESRFKSGNSVPVERVHITRDEFDAITRTALPDVAALEEEDRIEIYNELNELAAFCETAIAAGCSVGINERKAAALRAIAKEISE